jgi:hypothetical protein
MNDHAVIERSVGRHNDVARLDYAAALESHARRPLALRFNLDRTCLLENVRAASHYCVRHAGNVAQWVKFALAQEPQAWSQVPAGDVEFRQALDARASGAAGGVELLVEERLALAGPEKEVAVKPTECAFDRFLDDDSFDRVYRGGLALVCELRAARAVKSLDLPESVVQSGGEVRRRTPGLASADRAAVDHDDRQSFTRQKERRRETGDTCADDADVGTEVFRQRGKPRDLCRFVPHRPGGQLFGIHERSNTAQAQEFFTSDRPFLSRRIC